MGVASTQVSASAPGGSLHIECRYVEVAFLPRLPVTLSLAGPMRSSRLPLPSLLSLFGALLILSPQLLTVNAVRLHDMPCNDRGVQKALASAVEQYNQERESSANYFKVLRIQDAKVQMIRPIQYHLKVMLVKTMCKKEVGKIMKYKMIQRCKQLPRNPQTKNCHFGVFPDSLTFEMKVEIAICM